MKTTIQANLVLHARIVGQRGDFQSVLQIVYDEQWHVKVSGPRPTGHYHYDTTMFEILAERAVMRHEDAPQCLVELERALGAKEF